MHRPADAELHCSRVSSSAMARASGTHRPGEPVERGHDEGVPGTAGGECLKQPGASAVGAGEPVIDIGVPGFDTECGEAVALGGEILSVGGATDVADQQSRHRSSVPIVPRHRYCLPNQSYGTFPPAGSRPGRLTSGNTGRDSSNDIPRGDQPTSWWINAEVVPCCVLALRRRIGSCLQSGRRASNCRPTAARLPPAILDRSMLRSDANAWVPAVSSTNQPPR